VAPAVAAVLLVLAVLAGCAPTVPVPPPRAPSAARPPDAPPAGASYETLLEFAKVHPADADFGGLRMAFARSPHYQPYRSYPDLSAAMRDALRDQDWPSVLRLAQSALEINYVRARPHLHAARAQRALGNAAAAAHHRAMAEGLVKSVLASGDGLTPETAMVVIDIGEEYDVLAALRLRSTSQGLATQSGRPMDRHAVVAEDGREFSMFFDVALPFARNPMR